MTNSRYTNNDTRLLLGDLRSKIRNGIVTLYFRTDKDAMRKAVAAAFSLQDADSFNTENFNPQTLLRFAKLFDVPMYSYTDKYYPDGQKGMRYPSQDDAAAAIQNFINRRKDPWAHVRPTTQKDTQAQGEGALGV